MQGSFESSLGNIPAVTVTGTNGAEGIKVTSDGTAIETSSATRFGIVATTISGAAVVANADGDGIGLRATSTGGWAINAQSSSGVGILGASDTNVGVQGESQSGYNFGVTGIGANAGVAAFNPNNNHAAYLASDACAAWFTGPVTITGKLSKGGGGFKIDHPLDPRRKFLSHSFVESPDMKNMYDGTAIANRAGEAIVRLPKWFAAVNHQFRYQLTALGASAPELHVAHEIRANRFKIAGAKAGMKVSWQVTGIRRDAWAKANRIEVEEKKTTKEQGYYLHPELYQQPPQKSIEHLRHRRIKIRPGKPGAR